MGMRHLAGMERVNAASGKAVKDKATPATSALSSDRSRAVLARGNLQLW